MRGWDVRTGISVSLTPSGQLRFKTIVSKWNTAQKHIWRASIVLLTADGIGTAEIMCRPGTSKTCV
jgi:hypothetical protein